MQPPEKNLAFLAYTYKNYKHTYIQTQEITRVDLKWPCQVKSLTIGSP